MQLLANLIVALLAAGASGRPLEEGSSLEQVRPGLSVYRAYGRAISQQTPQAAAATSAAPAGKNTAPEGDGIEEHVPERVEPLLWGRPAVASKEEEEAVDGDESSGAAPLLPDADAEPEAETGVDVAAVQAAIGAAIAAAEEEVEAAGAATEAAATAVEDKTVVGENMVAAEAPETADTTAAVEEKTAAEETAEEEKTVSEEAAVEEKTASEEAAVEEKTASEEVAVENTEEKVVAGAEEEVEKADNEETVMTQAEEGPTAAAPSPAEPESESTIADAVSALVGAAESLVPAGEPQPQPETETEKEEPATAAVESLPGPETAPERQPEPAPEQQPEAVEDQHPLEESLEGAAPTSSGQAQEVAALESVQEQASQEQKASQEAAPAPTEATTEPVATSTEAEETKDDILNLLL